MSQTIATLMRAVVDYETTLVLAIELSNKNWVLAAQVPGLPHTKAKRTIDPEASFGKSSRPLIPGILMSERIKMSDTPFASVIR